MSYEKFLDSKQVAVKAFGFTVKDCDINQMLFPFQRAIVKWAIHRGRAAIFADCGLGKTFMQLEWARLIHIKTGKPTLILAPLAVAGQTVNEAAKLGNNIEYCRLQMDANGVIDNITNYEMLANFNMSHYGGIVLDESSILKNYTGKTKQLILHMTSDMEYRLACTATPAPNDQLELGNHSEFLGIMPSREMIQEYFVNDAMKAGGYRLRKHGEDRFWEWVASWAVALRWPSDVGDYDDTGYKLPDINFIEHIIPVDHSRAWNERGKSGQMSLLITGKTSATSMHKEKRATLKPRMKKAAEIAIESAKNDYVIVWCETNAEADELRRLLPNATEVRGNEKIDVKRRKLEAFSNREIRILVTKPKIAAHGLNWQHAGVHIWTSITHKFEPFYQGTKRSHRFGRKEVVTAHIIYAESEGSIFENLTRKYARHEQDQSAMVAAMRRNGMSLETSSRMRKLSGDVHFEQGRNWKLFMGDSATSMTSVPDESIDFQIQSPPFKSLYIYSDKLEDLGNSRDDEQFFVQYGYILRDELRRLKSGAYKAEHCKDLPMYKGRDGAMGLQDFPGELIRAHLAAGYWFVGWKTIWKDPVIEMQRTKNAGLLWSSAFCQRGERARQGMADYVLMFQKPIEGQDAPSTKIKAGRVPESVVDRCLDLWTNKGESVYTPFRKDSGEYLHGLIFIDRHIVKNNIPRLSESLMDGRNLIIRVKDPLYMTNLIEFVMGEWDGKGGLVFHSRVALTDGTWLVVFRKWVQDMPTDTHVTHDLVAPNTFLQVETITPIDTMDDAIEIARNSRNEINVDEYGKYNVKKTETDLSRPIHNTRGHEFVGNEPPQFWNDDRHYSILVWQRYASPVWFDLDGLPRNHEDIWFDIKQTNVLNHRIAKAAKDEKHICPLQLDLIERCIDIYTKRGDVVGSSFAGVGSEIVTAIEMGRYGIGSELKNKYFDVACEHARAAELKIAAPSMFELLGME